MTRKTITSSFGVSNRESHDSSKFYSRKLFNENNRKSRKVSSSTSAVSTDWKNKIYNVSSEKMCLPNACIDLAFTSPPYNVGKDYDDNMTLDEYLAFINNVGKEVFRVLKDGGRYIINIANLGRKPYIPLHSYFYQIHMKSGFLPMGEIIWQKGKGASGSCAWGSWKSAKAPRLRDVHEYLLVFTKNDYSKPDKGISDISSEEFMSSTLSIWQINPASAKKIGHPAPFPIELAAKVIRLYSYVNDVVLDPFVGSGTTCIAAKQNNRCFVGFDTSLDYCRLAEEQLKLSNDINRNTEEN